MRLLLPATAVVATGIDARPMRRMSTCGECLTLRHSGPPIPAPARYSRRTETRRTAMAPEPNALLPKQPRGPQAGQLATAAKRLLASWQRSEEYGVSAETIDPAWAGSVA